MSEKNLLWWQYRSLWNLFLINLNCNNACSCCQPSCETCDSGDSCLTCAVDKFKGSNRLCVRACRPGEIQSIKN